MANDDHGHNNTHDNNTHDDGAADDEVLSPLFMLAVSMAFAIKVDGHISSQQRGGLVALFGKLVEVGAINEGELHNLIGRAFTYAANNRVEDFIGKARTRLTETQKLAIVINLYEAMQVDGHIKMGERGVVHKFEEAFAIDPQTARGIHEFLTLKNDTSIFLDLAHPLNNTAIDLADLFRQS